jgi:hypothetical protein
MDAGAVQAPRTGLGKTARRHRRALSRGAGPATLWGALAVTFLVVILLGFIGVTRYQEAAGALDPPTNRLYLALQLFVLEGGSLAGPVPWQLEVARVAAPVLAGYAILRLVAIMFREQVGRIRMRALRGHTVLAGLGRKGTLLAHALLERGEDVVVIEIDPANAELDTFRALGGLVLPGDARGPASLVRARVREAQRVIVLCGADATNLEVAARVRELAGGRPHNSLHCIVHLTDPELGLLLSAAELERYGEAPVRVDFVNVYEVAAHALLAAHPPSPHPDGSPPVVAIVGSGPMASHLLLALARAWAALAPERGDPLPIVVSGTDGGTAAGLRRRHPELEQLADVREADGLAALCDSWNLDRVFVCPDDPQAAAAHALELRGLLAGVPARIVVVLEERSGVGRLLEGMPVPPGGPELAAFGLLDEACCPEVFLAGMTEVLAKALHEAYRAAVMPGSPHDPALLPWGELPEHFRESNRDQAAHIAVKLRAVGRTLGPIADWRDARLPFPPLEVEAMARLEHDRWMAERRRVGWRPGPRDPQRRTTPYLVPWEELSEAVRDRDRLFIRRLPELLASVGLQALSRAEERERGADAHGTPPVVDPPLAAGTVR